MQNLVFEGHNPVCPRADACANEQLFTCIGLPPYEVEQALRQARRSFERSALSESNGRVRPPPRFVGGQT
jgi:hypothetical protein